MAYSRDAEIAQTLCQKSKCRFGCKEIAYLDHLISAKGMKANPDKLKAMVQWPFPKSLKTLKGFFGLMGYYQIFIRRYGAIAAPLRALALDKSS